VNLKCALEVVQECAQYININRSNLRDGFPGLHQVAGIFQKLDAARIKEFALRICWRLSLVSNNRLAERFHPPNESASSWSE